MEVNVEYVVLFCEIEKEYEELLEVLKSVEESVLFQWFVDSQVYVYCLKGDILQVEMYLEKVFELDLQNFVICYYQVKWFIMEYRYEEVRKIFIELLSEDLEDYVLF